jgi:hypothetical protein
MDTPFCFAALLHHGEDMNGARLRLGTTKGKRQAEHLMKMGKKTMSQPTPCTRHPLASGAACL